MPRDCYAWIDPFEEIARAERAASSAYEQGTRSVMRLVSGHAGEQFNVKLEAAVDRAAHEVARDIVKPHMAADYFEYTKWQETERRTLRGLAEISRPVLNQIQAHSEKSIRLDMRPERHDLDVTFTVKTLQPFQYNVTFTMDPWL